MTNLEIKSNFASNIELIRINELHEEKLWYFHDFRGIRNKSIRLLLEANFGDDPYLKHWADKFPIWIRSLFLYMTYTTFSWKGNYTVCENVTQPV